MEEEIWKVIPDYEKYEASSLGNIRSNWFGKTTNLKPQMHVNGYYQINLRKNKKKVTLKVHQLVAMTFLNHVPCGMNKVIDHINEIKTDNRLVNLQILTTRENVSRSTKGNSIYPGVSKRKNDLFYETKIKHNGKLVYLGIYKDELEAAQAYTNYLKIINMTLSDLFNARKKAIDFTDGQKQALNKVYKFLQSDDTFFLLAGYSGCGKTTIAENIANATKASLLAPTNAAVNRIKEKINNDLLTYSTIHGALFAAGDKKNTFYLDKSLKIRGIYIIDECSMIDKYVLEVLIKQATEKKCKIIFMGDSFQLEPVGENPYIFNWEKSYPDKFLIENKYELTEVKRYDGTLLKIATEMRINKKASFIQPEESDLSLVKKFSKSLAIDINNGNNYVVITSTNEKRVKYNEKIRSYLFRDKEINMYAQNNDTLVAVSNSNLYSNGEIFSINKALLVEEFAISIEDRKDNMKSYAALLYRHHGQMTLLIPNLVEASLHGQQIVESIKNGSTIVSNKTYDLLVKKFQPKHSNARYFLNKDITIATYGYAISCHKAQGQEWENVYIDAEWLMPVWDNAKWFYTAITRAKCKVEVTQNKYLKIN
jgi:energy-coupling factor transporter ATP-binding protein EcfA2